MKNLVRDPAIICLNTSEHTAQIKRIDNFTKSLINKRLKDLYSIVNNLVDFTTASSCNNGMTIENRIFPFEWVAFKRAMMYANVALSSGSNRIVGSTTCTNKINNATYIVAF